MKTRSGAHETVVIDGLTLHVRSYNEPGAQAIIMVHGIGVSGTYYERFASVMAEHYTVYVPDLPGYGETPRPPEPLSIPELARLLRDYMHTAGIKRPVLIGHSMGCQIVAEAWRQEPGICSKLILLGPTVNPRERTLPMQAWRLLEDTFREPPSANLIVFRDYIHMGPVRYVRTSRNMIAHHIEETLQGCTMPVLLVRGERDKIVPRDWVETLAAVIPNSQTFEMPDQPHIVQFQHPERLGEVCRDFIAA